MNEDAYMDPFFRYSYTFNKDTGEIEVPEIFLLDRQLHKLGRLYPVSDFNVIVNLNSYNEVSFNLSKYHNEILNELYTKLKNNSVVFVQGLGCFEVKVNETDNKDGIIKSVSGISLGESELSQILATIEVNTGDDIVRDDYRRDFPTVLYRPYNDETYMDGLDWSEYGTISVTDKKKILKESSLLHRILTYAPHYKVGHVDESLWYVQREFSFTDQNIDEILKSISEEIGCIFTFDTYLSDSGDVVRQINAYDMCYCKKCYKDITSDNSNFKSLSTAKYRSITNGVCDNCGESKFVYDFGEDTDIFLTTDNLTDDIQVSPENEVKNCLKIIGGDDMITSTVQALNMSSSNRIMMFSEDQKEEMSDSLREKIDKYYKEYSESQELFENVVKTEYDVIDLIQYLQSGKMPRIEDDIRDIQQEVQYILESINNDYNCNFYISSYNGGESDYVRHAYNSSTVSIRNLFTLYLDKGYSISIKNGDLPSKLNPGKSKIKWNGIITIYETDDRDNNYADIHVLKDGDSYTDSDGVTYNNTYVEYGAITKKNSNSNLIEKYDTFRVNLSFGDTDSKEFEAYIKQFCDAKLASLVDDTYKNRKEQDWKLYSYERLKSYYDGYESCLDALSDIYHTSTSEEKTIVTDIQNSYSSIQNEISCQMNILENQLNALYELYGVYPDNSDSSYKDYIKRNYNYNLKEFRDYIQIIKDLSNEKSNNYIGANPFACQECGSSNVGIANDNGNHYNYCKNCKNHDQSKILTYGDVAKEIVDYIDNSNPFKTEKEFLLDYIQNNTYYSYFTPSCEKYTIKESEESNHKGYIITCRSNTVTPIFAPYSTHHYSFTCNRTGNYIIENVSPYPLKLSLCYIDTKEEFLTKTIEPYDIDTCSIISSLDNTSISITVQTNFTNFRGARIYNLYTFEDEFPNLNCSVKDVGNYDFRGKYIWCSEQVYRNIQIRYTSSSIDSIFNQRNNLLNHFSLKNYLGNELYTELMPHIREDKYENSNYTSDGCLTNSQLVEKAKELLNKAKHTLATSCEQQYSLTSTIYAIVATKYRNWFDDRERFNQERVRIKIHDDYENFKIGNWIRCRIDNKNYKGREPDKDLYKLRLISIHFSYDNIDNTTVEFSNAEKTTGNIISDIQSVLSQASAISSSYDYVATQAEQGEVASKKVNNILQNGLDSALSAVKAGENQDIIMDRHGLLIRKYIPETDDYSKYQMKIINRNIVMTKDNWDHAELAIGLGMYNGSYRYGVWADLICGNLFAGNKLAIYGGGDGTTDNATVIIDGKGITLDGGAITWTKPIESSAVKGLNECLGVTKITSDYVISPKIEGGYLCIANDDYSVEIDPNHKAGTKTEENYLFCIRNKRITNDNVIMGVANNGDGFFKGNITATSGYIGGENGWKINGTSIINTDPDASASIMTGKISTESKDDVGTLISKGYIINGGLDGEGSSSSYKLAWLHNGAIDLFRQPRINSPFRTVITSDMMQCINGSDAWFYVNSIDKQFTVDGTAKFSDTAHFNNSLRLYYGYTNNYSELGVTALDSTAANAYFLVKSSMAVQNRLQVGHSVDDFLTQYALYVGGGNSYFTGDISVNEIQIRTETTSTEAANARFTTGSNPGHIRRSTASSKRYKHDITTTLSDDLDPHNLYDIDVVQYKYNKDYLGKDDIRYNRDVIGFIAEDIYEKYPIAADMTTKDDEKVPEDWNFRFILPAMLKLLQEQKQEIDNLKQRISELK